MTYKITLEDFRQIVNVAECRKNCKGHEVNNGTAEQGHSSCGSCPGNYYVGGECNYGGRHKLGSELDQINKNFEGFDVLVKRHAKLKKVQDENTFNQEKTELVNAFTTMKNRCSNLQSFFYASCVGVDHAKVSFQRNVQTRFNQFAIEVGKFINAVEKCTFAQFIEFKAKLKKLENMKAEQAKLVEAIKNEKDPAKKAQLQLQLNKLKEGIKGIVNELNNHPARDLFDDQISEGLQNIVRDLVKGGPGVKNNPFLFPGARNKPFGGGGNNNNGDGNNNQNTVLGGMINKSTWDGMKQFGLLTVVLCVLGGVFYLVKNKLK